MTTRAGGADVGRQDPRSCLARRAQGAGRRHRGEQRHHPPTRPRRKHGSRQATPMITELGLLTHISRRERRPAVASGAPQGPRPDHHRSEGAAPDDAEVRQGRHPQPGQAQGRDAIRCSISIELAALLKLAAKGRPSHAPLLLRSNGNQWGEIDPCGDYRKPVRRIVESIGLDPDVYGLYAFRHTSITRCLLAGTHTAIVAKSHDTSEAMIRKHYAASILDHTDSITRKTLPALGPARESPRATWCRWCARACDRAGVLALLSRRRVTRGSCPNGQNGARTECG